MILIRSITSGYIAEVDIDGMVFRSEFSDVVAAAFWARDLKREMNRSTADAVPKATDERREEDER